MKTLTSRRRGIALAAASAVAASTLLGLQAAPARAAAPAPTHGATVDYFDDVYTDLGANSVFETVTIERFKYILENVSGNVAFFIGDPSQASSQATIAHIDAVAKQQDIDRIYNFTPKIDGGTLNVWDIGASGLRALGRDYYAAEGDKLITNFLSKDADTPFTKNASTDPHLFVYNKDRTAGSAPDRIVTALTGVTAAADVDTPGEVEDYRDEVADVLGAVDDYETTTNFEFQKAENNRRHTTTPSYADTVAFGGNILEDPDAADGFRIKTLTYPELVHLLQQPGEFPILFGGTWCHNTRAIIKFVNADAQKHGIKTVYNFDFSLFSTSNSGNFYDHIRDNPVEADEAGVLKAARPSHLYGDLVNTYLTNAVTQYKKTGDPGAGNVNAVSYFPGGNTSLPKQEARKIQVGHLLTYNKDHQDALGNDAPVVDQAIRQNDDGGNTEHMTEWWYTAGANLPYGEGPLNGSYNLSTETPKQQLQNQRNFAKEALAEIDTILGGLADQKDTSTTSVTGLGGNADPVPGVGATPTIAVSVNSNDYAPVISLNTASGTSAGVTAAPATAIGKPRGFVGLFEGDEQIGESVRLSRTGTASITLPPQTAGEQSYTVRYLGRGDAIAPSAANLDFTVAGDLSTTVLEVPGPLVFGTGGAITATVPEDATGTVSLSGLPGDPIVAPVEEGEAAIAVPATLPAGTRTLVATYSGDDKYASSTDEKSLVVSKGASSVKASAAGTVYGTGATVNITSTGPNGYVPTGQVQVSVAGATHTATLDAQGRASVVLPRTLLPKTYAITIVHQGDGNVRAASTTASLAVAKAAASAPKFAKKGTVKASKKGKASVTVKTPAGLAKAGGKVKIVLSKGKVKKTITKSLSSGKAAVTLPKLAKGTWKVKVTYVGDATYNAGKTVSTTLKVKKG